MSWVDVEGPKDALRALRSLPGIEYVSRGARPVDPDSEDDRYLISAVLADDAVAIPAIEALGCVVHMLKTDAEIQAMLAAEFENRPPSEPIA